MEAKVRWFNEHDRSEKPPSGLGLNRWVFGVCHVDMTPPRDLVLAIPPPSQDHLSHFGPAQILSLPTAREMAEATIPCLLDAFIKPGATEPAPTSAPWTWSTLDADMAKAFEDALQKYNVKPELCKRDPVALGDADKCHGCGRPGKCFFKPLMKCLGCRAASYHSKMCRKQHWPQHKLVCYAPGATPSLDAHDYYTTRAPTDPEAQALMTLLRLDGHPDRDNITLALNRLEKHEEARIMCLLDPPPGSIYHLLNSSIYDPHLGRSPRPANEDERQKVNEVRETYIVLGSSRPNRRTHATLPIYTLAINTMDLRRSHLFPALRR
ncbi:hypothetical protein QBC34DRAFT_487975 [Podospora aff. communis PSN243]|uniref:MYND-type domain-containing protein n=1 Tax=Podospora aff. communis PSN243 TaxID=3040156 RepID=A0AAV9G8U7_9PEZI|nr:hypothetical protein QBC34DRAFT_487975 [Podospora aff. communis PSN243]